MMNMAGRVCRRCSRLVKSQDQGDAAVAKRVGDAVESDPSAALREHAVISITVSKLRFLL